MAIFFVILRAFVVNIFIKKVRFLLNIPGEFGIIQTAIEMAGISRRTASRKPQRGKDIEPAGQVKYQ